MKIRLTTLALLAVLALSGAGSAWANAEKMKGSIDELRSASTALQTSNPELAAKLTAIADRKEEMLKKFDQRKADEQAIKDASAALATTNPELSKKLAEHAKRMEEMKGQWAKHHGDKDKNCPAK